LVELLDRGLETRDVLVPLLDVGERRARRRVPGPLQDLLREHTILRISTVEGSIDLVLARMRLHDLVLAFDALAVLVLVLGLQLLILGHQVHKLSRQCTMHVRADACLGRAHVAPCILLILDVHGLQPVAHLRRHAVGGAHELLEPLCRFPTLVSGYGGQALAVRLLNLPNVVPDRRHRLLDIPCLVKEVLHK